MLSELFIVRTKAEMAYSYFAYVGSILIINELLFLNIYIPEVSLLFSKTYQNPYTFPVSKTIILNKINQVS